MEKTRALYLMISQTDTCIGRLIRTVTGYRYNHVSLTLDPSFRTWVSFGRFYRDVPLYGGFICECAERYLATGRDVRVRIFRLEVPESKCRRLEQLLPLAQRPECGLIYNSFDAVASALRCKVSIAGAYTCLSFACAVLGRQYRSIRALNDDLGEYLIYDGPLSALTPDSGSREDVYFSKYGALPGMLATARQFADLSTRPLRRHPDALAQRLR